MNAKNNLFLLIGFLSLLMACSTNAQKANLSVAEFEKGINQSNIQILDVRTPGEYQSGHLKNAFLADWNNQKEFQERVVALDKNKPVYTYCLAGSRSSAATEWLKQNGFTAYNLSGGISAWKKDNKPVEQIEDVKQITLAEYMAQIPKDKTVLVDFGAEWCPPCKKMDPVLDSLVKTHASEFLLIKIDAGRQTDISRELKVDALPTFIIYKGGKEVWRKQGITDAKEFIGQF
ncbi:MAG: thioredoxin domain-containing protein [Chitinophagaceae bacterium]